MGVAPSFAAFSASLQDFGRKAAAVDGDQFHSRANAGEGCGHALDGVGDVAVGAEFQAERVSACRRNGGHDRLPWLTGFRRRRLSIHCLRCRREARRVRGW